MMINRYSRIPIINMTVVSLIGVALFLGMGSLIASVSSQEGAQTNQAREKPMQKEEQSWVEVLRNRQLQRTRPEEVLEAIDELGKIARLRGISSTQTIKSLVEYLDVHQDSLVRANAEKFSPPGLVFEPHLIVSEERYPAVVVLMHVRKPALPILVEAIESNEIGSVASNNAIFVVKYNFREDFNNAAEHLREAAELSKSEQARQRLLLAVDKISRNMR